MFTTDNLYFSMAWGVKRSETDSCLHFFERRVIGKGHISLCRQATVRDPDKDLVLKETGPRCPICEKRFRKDYGAG